MSETSRRFAVPPLRLLIGSALVVFVVFRIFFAERENDPNRFAFDESRRYRVERVIDGDMLLLENGVRVRLLGVDTPETKHPTKPVSPLGLQAAEFTRTHVEGRVVRLQFDRERRDRYHRVLAYVYRDDWLLNEELIRQRFSRAQTRFSYRNSMKKRFRAAEAEAREHARGLWARPTEP